MYSPPGLRRRAWRKRNVIVLSTSSVALIVFGHLFFLVSWSLGFIVAKILGSKETGSPSKIPSVILPLGICRVHLHHWLISSAAMAFAVLLWSFPPVVFYGFLGGVALQGIYCYDDWHRVFILRQRRSPLSAITGPANMLLPGLADLQAHLQGNPQRGQAATLS